MDTKLTDSKDNRETRLLVHSRIPSPSWFKKSQWKENDQVLLYTVIVIVLYSVFLKSLNIALYPSFMDCKNKNISLVMIDYLRISLYERLTLLLDSSFAQVLIKSLDNSKWNSLRKALENKYRNRMTICNKLSTKCNKLIPRSVLWQLCFSIFFLSFFLVSCQTPLPYQRVYWGSGAWLDFIGSHSKNGSNLLIYLGSIKANSSEP